MKFDKNGIRILDSGANNLRKKCHPALHEWEEDEDERTKVAICIKCGEKDDSDER